MTNDELAEFKSHIENIKRAFGNPFWETISPSVNALVDLVDKFNDRLVEIERLSKKLPSAPLGE
jgi:hypothetical protein